MLRSLTPSESNTRKRPSSDSDITRPDSKCIRVDDRGRKTYATNASLPLYQKGTILSTRVAGFPRHSQSVSLDELLDVRALQSAILSTYDLDIEWLMRRKLQGMPTDVQLILPGARYAEKSALKSSFSGYTHVQLHFPLHGGLQHSKLMLLFFKYYVRLVVPTGNLCALEWGETGEMQNSLFVLDLPRKQDGFESAPQSTPDRIPFLSQLLLFLSDQGVDRMTCKQLDCFEWSATNGMGFVSSSFGVFSLPRFEQSGLASLSATIRRLGLATSRPVQMDYAVSSVGLIGNATLNCLHRAARGVDVQALCEADGMKMPDSELRSNTRIYYPTAGTVLRSRALKSSRSRVCLAKGHWEREDFPRECFRDLRPTRARLLSHSKILLVRGQRDDGSRFAWVYIGSANFSPSAWGRIDTSRPDIKCNNWESGIVLVAKDAAEELNGLRATFESLLDVPFECEDEASDLRYGKAKPWLNARA